MKTPDITLAQILAACLAGFYPLLTLLGVDLSVEQKDALDQLWAVALGLLGSDAAIRVGRNVALSRGGVNVSPELSTGITDPEPGDAPPQAL